MKPHSFKKLLLSVEIFSLCVKPVLADVTAQQLYEKAIQENTDAKYLDSIADLDAAIKMQPDFWKAYANRAAAEYNVKRYQVALNDLNTAMAHLPPGKGLTNLKERIERAMQPAQTSEEIRRREIALQAIQQIRAIQAGIAYPGQYGGSAYGISQLSNTLMARGYKIPDNVVHPNTTSTIHPNGDSGSATSQSQASASEAKLAALVGSTATIPQPATTKVSTSNPKIAVAKKVSAQAHASESEEKLAALAGPGPTMSQTAAPASTEVSDPAQKFLDEGAEKSRSGDWNGAIAAFDEYIKQNPNNFVGYANRGTARLQNGETEGAIVDLEKSVRLMPDNPNTKDYRDNLSAAIEQAKQSLKAGH